ncbi:MAG: hypothetical protein HYY16_14730 [Planctomycetes bacterium]|nr:hypothetical protein [Planctomycetota bacterium]
MQHKWAYFSMGIMSGIILMLVFALLMQHRENVAWARQDAGTDKQGHPLLMATGGSQANINDIVWVLHEHDPIEALRLEGTDEGTSVQKLRKQSRLSLLMYRCENQAKSMKLIAARDIGYDEEMIDYMTEKPRVSEVISELRKQADKGKKHD